MNGIFLSIAGLVLAFMPVQTANTADDYLKTVVDGLQEKSVFVDPGVPGTDGNTSSGLESKLQDGDGVILVMVPSTAQISDPNSFIQNLGEQLGNDDIIGLAIGDDTYAYSAIMPKGVATDLMDRAESVSTSNEETLVTFTRNVHRYVAEYPSEVPTPAVSGSDSSSGGFWIWGGVVAALVLAAVGTAIWRRRALGERRESIKLRAAPEGPRRHLEEILDLRKQVEDPYLQQSILDCCRDLEKYFQRFSTNLSEDAIVFAGHLARVESVLRQYLDVQDNGRYYPNPSDLLASGKQAIVDFGQYVLLSCQSGSKANLTSYTVKTQILRAQRYR